MTVADATVVAHHVRGRLRLRARGTWTPALLASVEESLRTADGVLDVRVNENAGSLIVEYDPATQALQQLLATPLIDAGKASHRRAQIYHSIVVEATPDEVWAVLTEPGRTVARLDTVVETHEKEAGVWGIALDLLGQRAQGRVRLTNQAPAEWLELTLEGSVEGRYVLSLSPRSAGTRLQARVFYRLAGDVLNRALGRLAEPALRRLVHEHLAAIDRLVAATVTKPA